VLRLLLPVAAVAACCAACGGHAPSAPPTTTRAAAAPKPHVAQRPANLVERPSGTLPAPLQDPSVSAFGTRVVLTGGLTAADVSSDGILFATRSGARQIGTLPSARHDTAAVALGRFAYVFGGGTASAQLDEIVRVDPRSGATALVGRLPAASSDSTAAVVGDTAYVVGGYTGTRWLDTIVAWRPGERAHVVAHLPATLRYAAVTAVDGRIVIAGGSLENGTASDAVLEFVPATGRVTQIGRLPAPTTHAAAAPLGNLAYVIGGRGALTDTPTARVVSIDPLTHRVRLAGRLRVARSDLAAAPVGPRILLAGGRARGGAVATLAVLVAAGPPARGTQTVHTADVYAHDGANMLAPAARAALPRIYVPNSMSNTVDVIDPNTYKVVEHFAVGELPQHVVPAWNLKTLYVTNDLGNTLTPIDPRTGKPGKDIPVDDPYNMYFTPNGRYAIVVAERLRRLDFRNAHTFALHKSVYMPCVGPDHMDFSADGRYVLVSCEFSGQMVKVDVAHERVVGTLDLPGRGQPQDVKLSPDGSIFYVADMRANGLWEIDGGRLKVVGFLHTGLGVHGLYPSRDSKYLYATNRGEGSVSVISFRTRKVVATWRIPGGGSPDMGGVSADGKVLWLSGRYSGVVYAISTRTGRLLARIPVGAGPHGLCVWPQPGRYSLGHTGILR
jgi:YVTN family beta-propeller protein